jgi:hypothetical protein
MEKWLVDSHNLFPSESFILKCEAVVLISYQYVIILAHFTGSTIVNRLCMGFSNPFLRIWNFKTFSPRRYMTLDVINAVVENYRWTVSGSIIFFNNCSFQTFHGIFSFLLISSSSKSTSLKPNRGYVLSPADNLFK